MRYLAKAYSQVVPDGPRAAITEYLSQIYDSVAETLPDVRENGFQTTLVENMPPELQDTYAEALNSATALEPTGYGKVTRKRGRKAKRKLLTVAVNQDRLPENGGPEVRWLPPGGMKDYFDQFRVNKPESGGSFVLFWRVAFAYV